MARSSLIFIAALLAVAVAEIRYVPSNRPHMNRRWEWLGQPRRGLSNLKLNVPAPVQAITNAESRPVPQIQEIPASPATIESAIMKEASSARLIDTGSFRSAPISVTQLESVKKPQLANVAESQYSSLLRPQHPSVMQRQYSSIVLPQYYGPVESQYSGVVQPPQYSTVAKPSYAADFHPHYSAVMNPQYYGDVQRQYSGIVQPKYTSFVQQPYTPSVIKHQPSCRASARPGNCGCGGNVEYYSYADQGLVQAPAYVQYGGGLVAPRPAAPIADSATAQSIGVPFAAAQSPAISAYSPYAGPPTIQSAVPIYLAYNGQATVRSPVQAYSAYGNYGTVHESAVPAYSAYDGLSRIPSAPPVYSSGLRTGQSAVPKYGAYGLQSSGLPIQPMLSALDDAKIVEREANLDGSSKTASTQLNSNARAQISRQNVVETLVKAAPAIPAAPVVVPDSGRSESMNALSWQNAEIPVPVNGAGASYTLLETPRRRVWPVIGQRYGARDVINALKVIKGSLMGIGY